MEQRINSVSNS